MHVMSNNDSVVTAESERSRMSAYSVVHKEGCGAYLLL